MEKQKKGGRERTSFQLNQAQEVGRNGGEGEVIWSQRLELNASSSPACRMLKHF